MALASYVLMFAGSPQTFVGYATAQDSWLMLFDILPPYVRHVRSQLEQRYTNYHPSLCEWDVRFSRS